MKRLTKKDLDFLFDNLLIILSDNVSMKSNYFKESLKDNDILKELILLMYYNGMAPINTETLKLCMDCGEYYWKMLNNYVDKKWEKAINFMIDEECRVIENTPFL